MIFGELETQASSTAPFWVYLKKRWYFSIPNNLRESGKNPDVLAAFLTNDSPIMFSLFSKSEGTRGKGL